MQTLMDLLYHLNFTRLFLITCVVMLTIVTIRKLLNWRKYMFICEAICGTIICLVITFGFFAITSTFIEWPEGREIYTKNDKGVWQVYKQPVLHSFLEFEGITKADEHHRFGASFPIRVTNHVTGEFAIYQASVVVLLPTNDKDILRFLNTSNFVGDSANVYSDDCNDLYRRIRDLIEEVVINAETWSPGMLFLESPSRNAVLRLRFASYGLQLVDCQLIQ